MSEHITQWLNAYLDGELSSNLVRLVETHLMECHACHEEYRSLQGLSSILQEAPLPQAISPARFASQVALRLPTRPVVSSRNKVLDVGWWLVPIGLMALWIFVQMTFALSDWISTGIDFGFISNQAGWALFSSPQPAQFTSALGEFGLLGGRSLEWATWSESFTRTFALQVTWQVSIAILYLSWIAIWWAHRKPKGNGQIFDAGSQPVAK